MKYFLLFITFALSAIGGEYRILCLGDSLTAGYGVQENEAWPALLQKQVSEDFPEAKIINAGAFGATCWWSSKASMAI